PADPWAHLGRPRRRVRLLGGAADPERARARVLAPLGRRRGRGRSRRVRRPPVGARRLERPVTVAAPHPACPYKALAPFADTELDALLFFGREREREIVVANLIASRLTVLYGPSGVGKSSLLRAGVARALRGLPERPVVVVFSSWAGNLAEGLTAALCE